MTIIKVALAPFQTGSCFSGPFVGETWAHVALVAKPHLTSVEVLMKPKKVRWEMQQSGHHSGQNPKYPSLGSSQPPASLPGETFMRAG